MTEKRFTYDKPLVAFSKGGINDNVTGETYEFTIDTVLDLLNELHEENEHYKSIFFDIVESALEDKNCRELYCKGILSLFDDANSLNQAKKMIKEHLE